MRLTILSVGYPFAPAGLDAAGGAEQVLSMLDEALVRAGHRSIVVAPEGSSVQGKLLPIPGTQDVINGDARLEVHTRCRKVIERALAAYDIDLVHMHGLDFESYLPPPGPPVLATLHLPLDWYAPAALRPERPGTWLHCVSRSQQGGSHPEFLPVIENGVHPMRTENIHRRNFAAALGRICPEKGYHLALDAARIAQTPLLLAGKVFPYAEHETYFHEEIQPRLDDSRRFIGPVGPSGKRRLLAAARCLLVPSLVAETSSLVAMEALACGTPVIAFPSGALTEIVEDGRTGFLVRNAGEMAGAIRRAGGLRAAHCRAAAAERFPAQRAIRQYFDVYERLSRAGAGHAAGSVKLTSV